jgi:hypothetical protein
MNPYIHSSLSPCPPRKNKLKKTNTAHTSRKVFSPIRYGLYAGADRADGEAVAVRELAQILVLLLGHVHVERWIVGHREARLINFLELRVVI